MATRWLLALESSTPHGGSALLRDGDIVAVRRLEEGLRHGRELVSSAQSLFVEHAVAPRELWGVAVSAGPGSYTGIRVGVMAAKALAYAAGALLAVPSSLAALAQTRALAAKAVDGDRILVVQNARRDEVYSNLYTIIDGEARSNHQDIATTPEEAAVLLDRLLAETFSNLLLAGSGFATYRDVFLSRLPAAASCLDAAADGRVDPGAVGIIGHRQIVREETADPMQAQPVYLRRDEGADWRHDHLITPS